MKVTSQVSLENVELGVADKDQSSSPKPIKYVNPYLMNGFSHHYHLGQSTFIFRGVRSDFKILFIFSMKMPLANIIAPDGTPRSAASHLGYYVCPCPIKGMPGLNELNTI